MSKIAKILVVCMCLVVTLSLAGCATLFKEKTAEVNINSDPEGADVYINGNRMGKTPLPILLSHNNKHDYSTAVG